MERPSEEGQELAEPRLTADDSGGEEGSLLVVIDEAELRPSGATSVPARKRQRDEVEGLEQFAQLLEAAGGAQVSREDAASALEEARRHVPGAQRIAKLRRRLAGNT